MISGWILRKLKTWIRKLDEILLTRVCFSKAHVPANFVTILISNFLVDQNNFIIRGLLIYYWIRASEDYWNVIGLGETCGAFCKHTRSVAVISLEKQKHFTAGSRRTTNQTNIELTRDITGEKHIYTVRVCVYLWQYPLCSQVWGRRG